MLEVKKLSHLYGSKYVLKDINFKVINREILVIMGASGGGKSTLLKCLSGLLTPVEGDILLNDQSILKNTQLAPNKFGFVFQYSALFDLLTIEDNILFGVIRHKNLTPQEKRQLVEKQLEAVALPGIEKSFPSELSGGMRKRVGVARALASEPDILFYDEPVSGLDPATAFSIDKLIVETRDRFGVSSIVVTHDLMSALRIADRIAFLDKGKLVFIGNPSQFLESDYPAICELIHFSQSKTLI